MTRNETIKVLALLKLAYPSFYKDMTKDTAIETIDFWSMMFAEEDLEIVLESVKALITTCKFPPSIADVKEKIRFITLPRQMNELEAWNLVNNAIRNSYYNASESFDKLPILIQKLVGSPNQLKEWAMMEISEVKSVVQSNFMRSFRARVENERQVMALPASTKLLIQNLGNNFKMIEGGENSGSN
jgi:hypothetical protein